ncbi:MAG: bifunctional (p)ppGpp synthetase/guanosine-3',5'-bis(diphosphate) 3'-pyrophosphohydrolase [Deltaproteobacteria bacterium]|nr:bifunctional (p)ppGpp synthetase/guanosine-3',5'-bis(diphosphate) 3'-pyrophosphohydrolase [Deltaproteobacteria bacterium]
MLRLNDILDTVRSYHPEADFDLIRKAYVYSAKVHQGQVRKSGEPYLVHPLEVSGLLAGMKMDEYAISAGILHDTIEDTLATVEELKALFGEEVAEIVEGVTKLSNMPYSTSHERAAENFRKMVVAMTKDIRVILVKLADRLHNMRTLEHMKPEKQEKIAQETLDIYAPLANRLGINWIKSELQNQCLRYLHPTEYADVEAKLESTAKDREAYIAEVKALLSKKMADNEIECRIEGRVKTPYSIWKKMKSSGSTFEELHDIVAFRIITAAKSNRDCYGALGLCHEDWRPVPNRIKDFIATPKPNGYRSLHTTVIGPSGQRIEIQIRTDEMHRIAEHGIAAHWRYKEGTPAKGHEFDWLRQIMESQREIKDPTEFLTSVKFDLFGESVYVFTPRGEVKELRAGATPIDFAFSIHSEVGYHCYGARVNGRMVPLKYRLKNGDTIEIITSPSAHPTKDWLPLVKSSKARNRINAYIRAEQRRRSITLGADILEKELRRYGTTIPKATKKGLFQALVPGKHYHNLDDLLSAIGYGKITGASVARRILPVELTEKGPKEEPTRPKPRLTQLFEAVARKNTGGIQVQGLDDILVTFGKCCSPVPGDPIIGFVTRGRGVTIHASDCSKAQLLDPERKVQVDWDKNANVPRSVTLRVITENSSGILAKISSTFTGAGVNILNANCRSRGEGRAVNTFIVAIKDVSQLKAVMRTIQALPGIHSVERTQV